MYMAHVCFYVCRSDRVRVGGNAVAQRSLLNIVGSLSLGVLKYVVCLCSGCDGCCVFFRTVRRGAVGAPVWEV